MELGIVLKHPSVKDEVCPFLRASFSQDQNLLLLGGKFNTAPSSFLKPNVESFGRVSDFPLSTYGTMSVVSGSSLGGSAENNSTARNCPGTKINAFPYSIHNSSGDRTGGKGNRCGTAKFTNNLC